LPYELVMRPGCSPNPVSKLLTKFLMMGNVEKRADAMIIADSQINTTSIEISGSAECCQLLTATAWRIPKMPTLYRVRECW